MDSSRRSEFWGRMCSSRSSRRLYSCHLSPRLDLPNNELAKLIVTSIITYKCNNNFLCFFLETSTALPKLVPKQECSGMICRLGTGICLDQYSICDDKVDCLNAEDEVDCRGSTLA